MGSISTYGKKGDRRRIHFTAADGTRPTVYLGKISEKGARSIRVRIEEIVNAQIGKYPLDPSTAQWVADLAPTLAEKLAQVGLIPEGRRPSTATLGAFLDDHVKRRIDVKPATKEVWSQVVRNLKKHFGESRELSSIGEGDAEDFKLFLIGQKLASTTVSKRLQFARAFFRAAKKRKLVLDNPFVEVTAKATAPEGEDHFVTVEEAAAIMRVCDPTWRTIFGLARWGGLRCPSEVLSLRWEGVDWENARILVHSPKTEYHGKSSRIIPMFPELRPILEEAWELAPERAEYVVGGGYRAAALGPRGWQGMNLRTHFSRIIRRAGLEPWKRLWKAVRGTRETELERDFPLHVVTRWLGNTPKIAQKHYLQVTPEDFARAAGARALCNARGAQNTTLQGAAGSGENRQEKSEALGDQGLTLSPAAPCGYVQDSGLETIGLEPTTPALQKRCSPN